MCRGIAAGLPGACKAGFVAAPTAQQAHLVPRDGLVFSVPRGEKKSPLVFNISHLLFIVF